MADYLRRPGDSEAAIMRVRDRVREERRESYARATRRIEQEPIAHGMGEAALVERKNGRTTFGGRAS